MTELYGLTRTRLAAWLAAAGFSAHHVSRLWRYLYRELVDDAAPMSELPAALRRHLCTAASLRALIVNRQSSSVDGETQKFLLQLADERRIETVLMRNGSRVTACVSSQVGCALGCVFCATGLMGWERNLTTAEIVAQIIYVVRRQRSCPLAASSSKYLHNVVLMGMGEPLLNYDAVMDAVEIMTDAGGFAIGRKQVTLSTVGIVPGIIRLADERRDVSLAVSLHSVDQDERAALVPIARTWPLHELIDACRYFARRLNRKIFFEWTLIAGRNDSVNHARALVDRLSDLPAQVNLIPLNPIDGFDGWSGERERLARFREVLADGGIPVSIRRRRGVDINAGCGQLAAVGST